MPDKVFLISIEDGVDVHNNGWAAHMETYLRSYGIQCEVITGAENPELSIGNNQDINQCPLKGVLGVISINDTLRDKT
ncbi:hypothetical protein L6252_00730 [Candidatus Parcubacteria bacterium]|nr:hypothetical protein [Candidatus Parcubacteria bacterium]